MVRITANPKTGQVFTQSVNADGTPKTDKNGNQFGYIRIVDEKINLNFAYNGALKSKSALKAMTLAGWEKSQHALKADTMIEGKIVSIDSFEPSFPGQRALQAPVRDENGNAVPDKFRDVTSGGKKVYRSDFYTDNANIVDQLFTYDKVSATVAKPAGTKLA